MMTRLHEASYFATLSRDTLLLVQISFTLLSTLLLTTAAAYADALKAQKLWALGNIVCCGGMALGVATGLPLLVHGVFSYGVLGLGMALILLGLRLFCGRDLAPAWVAAIALAAMVLPWYFAVIVPDQHMRFVVTGCYFCVMLLACAATLLRNASLGDSAVAVAGFGLLALTMFVRGVYVFFHPAPTAGDVSGILNACLFAIALAQVCIAFGMTIMVLRQHAGRLKQLATIDALTGALNRAGLDLAGQRIIRRAQRDRRSVAVLLVDADHFKAINDDHGHAVGDIVLRHLSDVLAAQTRPNDMLVRLGGEEFVLVLDGMTLDAATIVAERLRHVVSEATVDGHGKPVRYTVSIGAAGSDTHGYNLMQLISKGDAAMYEAKRAGRNRVAVAMA